MHQEHIASADTASLQDVQLDRHVRNVLVLDTSARLDLYEIERTTIGPAEDVYPDPDAVEGECPFVDSLHGFVPQRSLGRRYGLSVPEGGIAYQVAAGKAFLGQSPDRCACLEERPLAGIERIR